MKFSDDAPYRGEPFAVGDLVEEVGYDLGRGAGVVIGFTKEVPHWWRGAYRMGTIHVLWCGSDIDPETPLALGRNTELTWAMANKIRKIKQKAELQGE
jgi:hypothetical protein